MAPAISCLVAAAVAVAAAAEPVLTSAAGQLDRILRGEVPKDELEIVLAQYNEDLSWSDKYGTLRTVYCKGGEACASDAVRLENVGREGHTYLSHIVNNYDNLAKWTVFSQAGEPSVGYKGQNQGGGHMLSGATFSDYLVHPQRSGAEDPEAFFLMTSKVHLPTMHHALRSSYQVAEGRQTPKALVVPSMCPAGEVSETSSDTWADYEDLPMLLSFVSDKCGVEEGAAGEAMLEFWDSFVQLPRPKNDIVHYAQGARFAVSRDRIRQRSKSFYERLLSLVSADADPCLNYLYEWTWYYIVGKPETSPCTVLQDEQAHAWAAKARLLARGVSGVSGISGVSGGDPPTPPTPAPENQISPTPAPEGPSPTPAPKGPSPTPAPEDPSPTPAPKGPSPTPAPKGPSPTPAPKGPSPTPAPEGPSPTPAPLPAPSGLEQHFVRGSVNMQVENPAETCADVSEDSLAEGLRRAQAGLVDVPVDDVTVSCSVPERRLGSNGRRLAGIVEFSYRIAMNSSEAASAAVTQIEETTPEAMTKLISEQLQGSKYSSIQVLSLDAEAVVVTAPTTDEEDLDSHARSPAALGSTALAVMAAALTWSH